MLKKDNTVSMRFTLNQYARIEKIAKKKRLPVCSLLSLWLEEYAFKLDHGILDKKSDDYRSTV
jgi:hypothetical protein